MADKPSSEHTRLRDIYLQQLPPGKAAAPSDAALTFLRRHLTSDRDATILDAGCGNAPYALALAEDGYTALTGIDLFDEIQTHGRLDYRRASIDDTGCADASLDAIYSLSVIFYLKDPRSAFHEFNRILKPGGLLVLSAHTRHSLFTLQRRWRRARGHDPHLQGIQFDSASSYRRQLREVGFEHLESDGYPLLWAPTPKLQYAVGALEHRLINTPFCTPDRPAPAWLRALRSRIGYHSLIAARKPV